MRRIALLGNHLPRQCGIATFTTDLGNALAAECAGLDCFVLAMNDAEIQRAYPPRVRFELGENDLQSYHRAADFLNVNAVDVVSVQHEYGIFGGKAGSHVLALLRELRMPVVTTLHTILGDPAVAQRRVMNELVDLSERLVVMSEQGAALLKDVHGVDASKIDLIPHGSPPVASVAGSKERLSVAGKSVLLTFGLISPDKGIEYVIDALPAILARFPETVYIVLGVTHPHVKERDGDGYRLNLETRARALGVDGSVIFHNRFVSELELTEFLAAADICVTPYLKPDQIASGALAFAVGAGKAIISTPYRYASELLGDGRGLLVPWRDAPAIAEAVASLLGDDEKRRALGARAGARGREMGWPAVARRYLDSFSAAVASHAERARTSFEATTLAQRPHSLPVNLEHIRLMTDETGLLQHAVYNVPRYEEGYCLDDNARALLLMTQIDDAGTDERPLVRALAARYLAFVSHAFDRKSGRFRNFMSYARKWTEKKYGSEDSQGRALWALGGVVGRADHPGTRSLAGDLFHAALPAVSGFSSPRAWSYALLGLDEYLRAFEGESGVQAMRHDIAARLFGLYQRNSSAEWPWFEDRLTYCNARLSQALIVSGAAMEDEAMIAAGTESLDWLLTIQRSPDGNFAPVGSDGLGRGEQAEASDQQPVEACAIIGAALAAHRVTGEPQWADHAKRAFNWFLGHNHLHTSLYDPSTGGCRDGLHADRANENQGAESTLSFLLALVDLRSIESAALYRPVLHAVTT